VTCGARQAVLAAHPLHTFLSIQFHVATGTPFNVPHTVQQCGSFWGPVRCVFFFLLIILCIMREERKPTRCNNIDDLLSIVDVDY